MSFFSDVICYHRKTVFLCLAASLLLISGLGGAVFIHMGSISMQYSALSSAGKTPEFSIDTGSHYEDVSPSPAIALPKNLALMGRKPASAALPDINETPETARDIKLRGVFANSQSTDAGALISIDGGKPQYFYIGDKVDRDIKLVSITAKGVMLESEEGFEKLVFSMPSIWVSMTRRDAEKSLVERDEGGRQSVSTIISSPGLAGRALKDSKDAGESERDAEMHQRHEREAQRNRLADVRARLKSGL